MGPSELAFWGVFVNILLNVSSDFLARSSLFNAANTSSSFLNPLEDPDDDLPEFLAALEALQPDPDMMPVEREGNGAHYIKPRNTLFWDTFKREADEVSWKKLLRVSTTTFDYLVEQLTCSKRRRRTPFPEYLTGC
jgi:hypothetical protein